MRIMLRILSTVLHFFLTRNIRFVFEQYSSSAEQKEKYDAFKKTLKRIDDLNAHERAVKGTAVFGLNKFSDLTIEEFERAYLGTRVPAKRQSSPRLTQIAPAAVHTTVTSVDWRGIYTTPIKDQGGCGSCWYVITHQLR